RPADSSQGRDDCGADGAAGLAAKCGQKSSDATLVAQVAKDGDGAATDRGIDVGDEHLDAGGEFGRDGLAIRDAGVDEFNAQSADLSEGVVEEVYQEFVLIGVGRCVVDVAKGREEPRDEGGAAGGSAVDAGAKLFVSPAQPGDLIEVTIL